MNVRFLRVTIFLLFLVFIAAACGAGTDGLETGAGRIPSPTARPHTATPAPSPTPIPSLALADIFPPRDLSALKLDPSRVRTVIATGDVIPARHTDVTIRNRGEDFLYPVAATKEITAAADLTVINLEAPLIEGCPYHDSGFTFCGRPAFVQALEAAGVDVVTLENNHIGNYGPAGVEETKEYFQVPHVSFPIAWADRDSPAIVEVRDLKFGFLAFNGVGETIDREAMTTQIKALRPKVDVLAVAFHWGAEYVSLPQAAPGVAEDDPVEIGHLAVDAGADLIIGNHPHWVQAVELYKGKLITYAHGNFIFDQMWSYETRVGVIGKYTFYDDRLVGVEYIPTLIEDYAEPVPMTGPERQAVLDLMRSASEELASRFAPAP